jgi:predicted RNA binding protein YcfA (HicA-like mRNA interferase family)
MTKREKRLEKIRQNPKHVNKSQLEQILVDFGFIRRDGKGSHTIYQHHKLETPVVIAVHGQHVPEYIVKKTLAAIDKISEQETSDDDKPEND